MGVSNLNYKLLKDILFGLIENEIINRETRKISYDGQKRETKYYIRTREGDKILDKFNEIQEQLTRLESP
ncbi:hypothetical protein ES702_01944 [subsurface metagenome]